MKFEYKSKILEWINNSFKLGGKCIIERKVIPSNTPSVYYIFRYKKDGRSFPFKIYDRETETTRLMYLWDFEINKFFEKYGGKYISVYLDSDDDIFCFSKQNEKRIPKDILELELELSIDRSG